MAFIGASDVVRNAYLPAVSRRKDSRLVAICSQKGESANELATLYGIEKVFSGYDEVLQQEDIDTVFVCIPTYLHRRIAEAAMKYNKNILVEKPL